MRRQSFAPAGGRAWPAYRVRANRDSNSWPVDPNPSIRIPCSVSLLLVSEHGQFETAPIFEELERRLRLHAQAMQTNEALGRVVIELIACFVRRQFFAVKAVIAFTANHRRLAFEEL